MPIDTLANENAIFELPDPFALERLPRKALNSVRRRLSHGTQWVAGKLQPSVGRQNQASCSPFVSNFRSGTTEPLYKRALMTYVASGFGLTPEQLSNVRHSNHAQAIEIAYAFNRLGYSVDVVDLWDTETVPQGKYDVFFGEYNNFGRLMPLLHEDTLKIFYGTRSYWSAEHRAIEGRAQRIKSTRGIDIPIVHWEQENNWVQMADAVIAIGNHVTAGTFTSYHSCVYPIDNSALQLPPPNLEQKNFAEARKNFLWLGSGTLLRKGLDLVLEAFAGLPDLHLWVCGPLEDHSERDFIRTYRRELFHTPNIHPIGTVAPTSVTLKTLVSKCASLVFASCSEGMSGGVLDCMAYGLIPIVSREAGIDTETFGITLEHSSIESIRSSVYDLAGTSPEVCCHMAQEAYNQTKKRYSLTAFSRNIEVLLRMVIERQSHNYVEEYAAPLMSRK